MKKVSENREQSLETTSVWRMLKIDEKQNPRSKNPVPTNRVFEWIFSCIFPLSFSLSPPFSHFSSLENQLESQHEIIQKEKNIKTRRRKSAKKRAGLPFILIYWPGNFPFSKMILKPETKNSFFRLFLCFFLLSLGHSHTSMRILSFFIFLLL